ncbi:Kinesin [Entamoeba marina]
MSQRKTTNPSIHVAQKPKTRPPNPTPRFPIQSSRSKQPKQPIHQARPPPHMSKVPTRQKPQLKPLLSSQLGQQYNMKDIPQEFIDKLTQNLGDMFEKKMEKFNTSNNTVVESVIEHAPILQPVINPLQGDLSEANEKIEKMDLEFKLAKEKMDLELRLAKEKNNNSEREIISLQIENESLKGQIGVMQRTVDAANSKCEMEKQLHEESDRLITELREKINSTEELLKSTQNELILSEDRLLSSEKERRRLHNEVMELKGNVRVFCRVRPTLRGETMSVDVLENAVLVNNTSFGGKKEKVRFSFDRAFPPRTQQEEIFEEISQMVQSSLDGYQTCIFAYGQTGSGKTYTMEGTPDKPGMIPLTVHQIFSTINELSKLGWVFKICVKYVEIYNDTILDLLADQDQSRKLQLKHSSSTVSLPDAIVVTVSESSQVDDIIRIATKSRAVAATNCNAQSSRSHSIFMMDLIGRNIGSNEQRFGGLTLVDLAGSERIDESRVRGERLEETKNINKSLSALGDVIMAIANGDSHVPFRNCKLTHLLQSNLLQKVNTCVIGTAKRHVK